MKTFKMLLTGIAASVFLGSCTKEVLNKQNLVSSTANQIFNDSITVKYNLDYIYDQNLPTWFGNTGGSIGTPNGLSDEQYSDNAYVKGTVTNETVTDIGTSLSPTNSYGKIRTINTFIRDVNAGSVAAATKKRFVAQALFFRAFRYFDLVRLYGGVPLVLTPLDGLGDASKVAAQIPRSSTSACIKQIVNDLDTCIKYLPAKWTNADYGRITSGAAAAFLGRVLLTYASPEFNPNNDLTRWQAAYDANTLAINILSQNGYGLNPSYQNMWFNESYSNPEAVLITAYNTSQGDQQKKNNSYDNSTRPAYLGTGGGSNQPTWDLVQAYPMRDGKAPGASTKYPYSVQTFYKNRDPRFDATIAYNGCIWPILGNTNYRLWTYYYYTKSNLSATKSTESSATTTGFYLRKAIDPQVSASLVQYSGTDWMEIRYAEVLLNQAEAAAEIGHLGVGQEAYVNLIAIRKRAGIEAGTDGLYGLTPNMGHDDMINAIMLERQIEFAFEGKRFWDLRRRKLLESTLNGKMRTGITILLNPNGSNTDYILSTRDGLAATSLDAMYSTLFTVKVKTMDTYNINFQPGDYFFGIPTNALQNNPALQQNNTWGGPFDPQQ